MSLPSVVARWLNQTITLSTPTGTAQDGSPTFGAQTTVRARVEADQRMVRDSRGELVQASHAIFTQAVVTIFDRVWLPGADTSNPRAARRVLALTAATRKNGKVSHYEVSL